MPLLPSLSYYRRIVSAYLLGGQSHLTFWHETPEQNLNANAGELGCSDDGGRLVREGPMMRLGRNITLKLPFYATIAPILHARLHGTPAHRGITLNEGAADANGR